MSQRPEEMLYISLLFHNPWNRPLGEKIVRMIDDAALYAIITWYVLGDLAHKES